MGAGAAEGLAAKAEAELRMRAQSWASPSRDRGWPARCGSPRQMGPWGQRGVQHAVRGQGAGECGLVRWKAGAVRPGGDSREM